MADRSREKIWGPFDEWGILAGLDRIPGESLLDFRGRILNHEKYDSTKQGLVHHVSDALLTRGYNIVGKKEFFSLRQPLSFIRYQALTEPNDSFYAPRITVGSTTWILPALPDFEKDWVESNGVTWYLWKQPDGSYDKVWTTDFVPSDDIELRYQWLDPNNMLHIIHESSKILTWVDGEVVEEYPPEVA
jgi:hypothetical protein